MMVRDESPVHSHTLVQVSVKSHSRTLPLMEERSNRGFRAERVDDVEVAGGGRLFSEGVCAGSGPTSEISTCLGNCCWRSLLREGPCNPW
jgi:hypothetical protein